MTAVPGMLQAFELWANPGVGGTAIVVRRAWLSSSVAVHRVVVPGRWQELRLEQGPQQLTIVNVHNYQLGPQAGERIQDLITQVKNQALAEFDHYATFMIGDFNF